MARFRAWLDIRPVFLCNNSNWPILRVIPAKLVRHGGRVPSRKQEAGIHIIDTLWVSCSFDFAQDRLLRNDGLLYAVGI